MSSADEGPPARIVWVCSCSEFSSSGEGVRFSETHGHVNQIGSCFWFLWVFTVFRPVGRMLWLPQKKPPRKVRAANRSQSIICHKGVPHTDVVSEGHHVFFLPCQPSPRFDAALPPANNKRAAHSIAHSLPLSCSESTVINSGHAGTPILSRPRMWFQATSR